MFSLKSSARKYKKESLEEESSSSDSDHEQLSCAIDPELPTEGEENLK